MQKSPSTISREGDMITICIDVREAGRAAAGDLGYWGDRVCPTHHLSDEEIRALVRALPPDPYPFKD